MKGLRITVAVIVLFAGMIAAQADESPVRPLTVYLGMGTSPLETVDFVDFHVSDWEKYGLGGAEGRVSLPLSERAYSGQAGGILLGIESEIQEGISVFAEGAVFVPSDDFIVGELSLGPRFFKKASKATLSISPKIGYILGNVGFGKVNLIEGTTAPVILDEGTFNVGDEIRTDISALSYGLTGKADYSLGDKFGLYLEVGYKGGISDDAEVVTNPEGNPENKTSIKLDSPAVVNPASPTDEDYPTTGNNPMNMQPKIEVQGTTFQIGISYRL